MAIQKSIFKYSSDYAKVNREKISFWKSYFLCSLERFISKSLQDRKKLQINYTHKSSVWVIVRLTGASSRRKGIRLVVCRCGNVYIKNFIFLIDTEEVGIYICSP